MAWNFQTCDGVVRGFAHADLSIRAVKSVARDLANEHAETIEYWSDDPDNDELSGSVDPQEG